MQQDISVGLGDIFKFIWRGLLLALLLGAIGASAGYFLSSSRSPIYRAEATVLINNGDIDPETYVVAPPIGADPYTTVVDSREVLGAALTLVGAEPSLERIGSLSDNLTVVPAESSLFRDSAQLSLQYEGAQPRAVADTVNAVANALVDWDRQRAEDALIATVDQLDRNIASAEERLAAVAEGSTEELQLQNQLAAQQQTRGEVAADLGTARSRLEVLSPAFPPGSPIAPKPLLNAVIAGALGFLLGYGILLVRNMLDTRLRNVEDLESISGLPILAEFSRPAKKTRRLSREGSGYLRTNLLLATQNVHPKVVLVTSPGNGEGKSSVALSLAESFTRANYRTLLVDADLRQPVIAREYNLDDKRHMPLRTHLENPHGSYEAAHVGVNLAQTLDIIPTFRAAPSPTELLSLGFPDCLASWEKDYDVIVIDSAPLLDVADTLTIAPLCTGTVLVASLEETDPEQVAEAVERLQRSGVRIFGIAATFVGRSSKRSSYRYGPDTVDLLDEREPIPGKLPASSSQVRGTRPR